MSIELKHFNKLHFNIICFIVTSLFFKASEIRSQGTCIASQAGSGGGSAIYAPFDACGNESTTKFTADAVLYRGNVDFCYGTITQVQYKQLGSFNAPNMPIKIFMKTVAATPTVLTSSNYNTMTVTATQVYNATTTFSTTVVPGWKTIILSTPFTFTTGNLVIITESNMNTTSMCGTGPIWDYSTRTGSHEYWWDNTSATSRGTSTGTVDIWFPSIRAGGSFLDVELVDFKGYLTDDKVKLEWSTASETNNDHFIVERSSDGQSYEEIARQKGAGNSHATLKYSIEDPRPLPGFTYYRLKQVDFNNVPTYSDPIYIEFESKKLIITNFYPNPTQNNIDFDVYSPTGGPLQIEILDYTGRLVSNDVQEIDKGKTVVHAKMDGLPKGIYFVKTTFAETDFTTMAKVIRN